MARASTGKRAAADGGTRGGRQALPAEPDRNIMVLALDPDRPRHAATARVDLRHVEARPPECLDRGRRAHERFLVTVTMEQRLAPVRRERKREPATPLALQELLEEQAPSGDRPGRVGPEQVDVLVAQREEAGGLEPDDRDPILGV